MSIKQSPYAQPVYDTRAPRLNVPSFAGDASGSPAPAGPPAPGGAPQAATSFVLPTSVAPRIVTNPPDISNMGAFVNWALTYPYGGVYQLINGLNATFDGNARKALAAISLMKSSNVPAAVSFWPLFESTWNQIFTKEPWQNHTT